MTLKQEAKKYADLIEVTILEDSDSVRKLIAESYMAGAQRKMSKCIDQCYFKVSKISEAQGCLTWKCTACGEIKTSM